MCEQKVTPDMEKQFSLLYKNGLGTRRIANKFKLGTTTVRGYLLRSGIKFRPDPKNKISEELGEKFVGLYGGGMSMKQIAERCKVSFCAVRNHLCRRNIKLRFRGNKKEILENADVLTPQKAYVLGVVGPGDGFIEFNSDSQQICLEATDRDFIDYFAFCLEKVYGIKPSIKLLKPRPTDTKPHYKVRLYSVEACKDLMKYNVCFRESVWEIPEVIKKSSSENIGMYLRGMADSQGCVSVASKHIVLCNNNTKGLWEMGKLLNKLDVADWYIHSNGLVITSYRSLKKFYEDIGFIIQRKRTNLEKLLANYKVFRLPQREITRLIPTILKLHKNNLTPQEIANETKLSVGTIYSRIRKFEENELVAQMEFLGAER